MIGNFVVLLTVAALAVFIQVQCSDDVVVVPRNDVEDVLKKLEAAVDKAMAQAQQALDDAKTKVDETAEALQASAVSEMQSTEQALEAEVDKLKQKAADAGVDISECLEGNEDQLVNLPNVLSDDMIHCVSDRIEEGISYAQDALNKLQEIVDEVENLRQEIKDCGHGIHAVKCLAKLALKIEEDITTLPEKIEADVAATVVLITQIEDKIKDCASSKVDQCESDGETILEKISVCVAEKIIT